ncbi:MAG: hypothetical protein ACI9VR_004991 [Cognaticolwellia sp.]
MGAILWAYRFTPALGINSVDGWADVAGASPDGLAGLWEAVASPLTMGVAGKNANFYRPVAMLWFGAQRALFGIWGAGWQATNLGLHLCCVGLVAALSRRLGGSPWEALAAAALLGLHPLGLDVVPAIDRSPDLLGTAFILGALLLGMRGWAIPAALVAVVALGTKETMLAGMPVLVALIWDRHGPKRALYALGLMAGCVGIYLSIRTQVLGGMGGYESAALRPSGLDPVLRAGALELLAAGWAQPLEAVFPSVVQQFIVGSLASAGLLALAYVGRDEANVRIGILLALLPLLLLGLTSAFSRRTIYLPLTGFVLLMSASVFRAPWGRWLGVGLTVLLLPGSPLVRPDRAWSLAAAIDRSLTLDVLDQVAELPDGAEVWLVDRCVQVDLDPWLSGMWRKGKSTVYCIGVYSVEAYFHDQLGRPIPFHKATNVYPEEPLAAVSPRVEGRSIVIERKSADRRTSRSAKDAGWVVQDRGGVLRITQGGELDRAWVLVAGVEDGTLVKLP